VEVIETQIGCFVSQLKEVVETSLGGARGQHLRTLRRGARRAEIA
jgi:hypothetical protein